MRIFLDPVPTAQFAAWIQRSANEYASDLITLGHPAAEAHRVAASGMADSFPGGKPAQGHHVFDIRELSGAIVGYLWLGRSAADDHDAWWLWDIVVNEDARGRGLGREAMELAEEFARSQNAHTLGLSVFGFNAAARRLYESLDYETTSIKMSKRL
ncbi:GNAT family N-acetyltransferase [Glaciibacter superstes]|uniref:GNAT family N-acetyltransferase n=1 Tax=Glaciibacter superstes TaxID=501023 RepID=UPI0003B3CCBB|nr:GNAT family N-acetyltransferase [Glaciibacter superstes]